LEVLHIVLHGDGTYVPYYGRKRWEMKAFEIKILEKVKPSLCKNMLLHIQEYRVSEEKLFISSALDGCH
jgi:hypothetical protein